MGQAMLHGTMGGMMNAINGQDVWSGYAAGAVSSLISSGIEGLTTTNGLPNGFGSNTPLLKATMIAAGGLSGGISSIAGGNFWDGARQGIITSGLNHAAHIGVEAYQRHHFDREIDRAFGAKADKAAPRSVESVYEVIEKVPTLKKFYDKFIKKYGIQINYRGEKGFINAEAFIYDDTGNSNINYYNIAFDSYYKLAHVTLHEFGHYNSAFLGFKSCNVNNFPNSVAVAIDEIYAYKFGYYHGGTSMDTDQYRNNVNILKNNGINAETLALPSFR